MVRAHRVPLTHRPPILQHTFFTKLATPTSDGANRFTQGARLTIFCNKAMPLSLAPDHNQDRRKPLSPELTWHGLKIL